ncbi:MAG: hypothetical protein DRI94_11050 [Bacteroidetes bacterium]|nr:MAG: hypothetical protein DRI94_11050 [Bacteroidota bacterium]
MIKFMNMPNRRSQPTFKTSEKIDIKEIQKILLTDSVPVYLLNSGDQDILKLDFVFNAGNIYHENSLIPEITNALIDKGTTLLSSEKISENFDFYGAYLETETGKHIVSVTLYTLNKYFKETFQLLFEILFDAFFPQSEIDIFLKNKYQSFLINQQKTDAVSTEIFAESIFGKNHPYGISVKENDFKNVERGQILNFYREYYNASNMFVMLSGKIKDEHLLILKSFLNQVKRSDTNHLKKDIQIPEKKAVKIFYKIENTVQVSIKVGKITINKLHPDFFNLNICSVILGGYFGSRLMTNIREDKGYTYGIYAGNVSLLELGFFVISADSSKDVYKKALEEIYKELKKIRTVPVGNEELIRVKRWLFGNIIKIFDGPLALSEAYKSIISYNLTKDYFYRYLEAIKNISPEIILKTAQTYLHEDTMTEVTVGA